MWLEDASARASSGAGLEAPSQALHAAPCPLEAATLAVALDCSARGGGAEELGEHVWWKGERDGHSGAAIR